MMSPGKRETFQEGRFADGELSFVYGLDTACPQHAAAGIVGFSSADAFSLLEPLFRLRDLIEPRENCAFKSQLHNEVVQGRRIRNGRQDAKGISRSAAAKYDLCFKQLEFRSPLRV